MDVGVRLNRDVVGIDITCQTELIYIVIRLVIITPQIGSNRNGLVVIEKNQILENDELFFFTVSNRSKGTLGECPYPKEQER